MASSPLGLLLEEVPGEQEQERLGVSGAPLSGAQAVSAKTAASLLPGVFSQLVAAGSLL